MVPDGVHVAVGPRGWRDGLLARVPVQRSRRDEAAARTRRRSEHRHQRRGDPAAGRGRHRLGGGRDLRVVEGRQRRNGETAHEPGQRPQRAGSDRSHGSARRGTQRGHPGHSGAGGCRRQARPAGLRSEWQRRGRAARISQVPAGGLRRRSDSDRHPVGDYSAGSRCAPPQIDDRARHAHSAAEPDHRECLSGRGAV